LDPIGRRNRLYFALAAKKNWHKIFFGIEFNVQELAERGCSLGQHLLHREFDCIAGWRKIEKFYLMA
jgi:hypothetical protein